MTAPLSQFELGRLIRTYRRGGAAALVTRVRELAGRGSDLAGFPFRLLDTLLAEGDLVDPAGLAMLADLLPAGQPRLFRAICDSLARGETGPLEALKEDEGSHAMTRWEALGWAVFLRHRAVLPSDGGEAVPRIVQFWDTAELPAELAEAAQSWAGLGVPARRFDAAHAARFIARTQGAEAARHFDRLWHPALKSDLFRLYFLYERGGLYADADSLPGPDIGGFLARGGGAVWAGTMSRVPNCVAINGFLAAPKGSPLIAAYLETALRNLHGRDEGPIFWLSGPGALTRMLWEGGHEIRLLPAASLRDALFRQFDAPYKRTERNWRVYEHRRGLSDGDVLVRMLG